MAERPRLYSLDWRHAPSGASIVYRDGAVGLAVGVWSIAAGAGLPQDLIAAAAGCVLVGAGALGGRSGGRSGGRIGVADGFAWAGRALSETGTATAMAADTPARGVFLTLDDPAWRAAPAEVATLKPSDDVRRPVRSPARPDAPQDCDCVRLSALDDAFSGGLWVSAPFDTGAIRFSYHELAMIREGAATIDGGDDGHDGAAGDARARRFGPGDAFFIAQGAPCRWRVERRLLKSYAAYAQP